MEKVNLKEKFALFDAYWTPKILGEVNESLVKIAKFKGEFLWHKHDDEDEMFFVVEGVLKVQFRDREVVLCPGEFLIIPKGVEHLPIAEDVVHVMLIEAKSTLNTGDIISDRTVNQLERL